MFTTLVVIALCLLGAVAGFVVWVTYYWGPRQARKDRTRPIVCVCRVAGPRERTGVVLRRDYDKASQAEWRPYIEDKAHYDSGSANAPYGRFLNVAPVFVFTPYSKEYYELVSGCFVERALFHVPIVHESDINNVSLAWEYFNANRLIM